MFPTDPSDIDNQMQLDQTNLVTVMPDSPKPSASPTPREPTQTPDNVEDMKEEVQEREVTPVTPAKEKTPEVLEEQTVQPEQAPEGKK